MNRIFTVSECSRPNAEAVERTVIHQTTEAALVVWHLLPGQGIPPHRHPMGQDTWTVVSGEADYLLGDGNSRVIKGELDLIHNLIGEHLGDAPPLGLHVDDWGISDYARERMIALGRKMA